jgi:hypothetical protein
MKHKTDELRRNYKTKGHISWIFWSKGNKRKSAGLTHRKFTPELKNPKNRELPHNPNPKDKSKSYFNHDIQEQNRRTYDKKDMQNKGWKMSHESKVVIISHYKRQEKRKKRNKKQQT